MFSIKKYTFYFYLLGSILFSSCQKDKLEDQDYKTLGTSANHFLSATNYSSMAVQISYMPGNEPADSSLYYLNQFLNLYLNKPGGITIFKKNIVASGKNTLTLKEIVSIENKYRISFTAGREIDVHILITDTYYSTKDILATSYWNTSYAIFGRTLNDFSGSAGQVSKTRLMTLLLCHEMGHLLGLVNQGTAMVTNHQDVAHGAHCNNINCLMNFGIETTLVTGNPVTSGIPLLDTNCHNDLKANGGK